MPAPLDPICLFTVLASHKVEYVLVGGMAAVLHGSPTVTSDADIVPAQDRENLIRLSGALQDLGARVRSLDEPEGVPFDPHPDLLASMAMLNLTTRCGDLDLTFNPAGIGTYPDLIARAVRVDIDGVTVALATLDDVVRSKRTADRPKDRAVLPVLEALRDELRRNDS